MVDLLDGYVGSSCVIKAKNNDLISMGVLHRIGKNFIDVGSSRNELPGIDVYKRQDHHRPDESENSQRDWKAVGGNHR